MRKAPLAIFCRPRFPADAAPMLKKLTPVLGALAVLPLFNSQAQGLSGDFVRSGVNVAKSYTDTALLDYIKKPLSGTEGYYLRLKSDGDAEWSDAIGPATQTALDAKQDLLVSGTNIKTINSISTVTMTSNTTFQ
jgi:hypothetical protein